MGALDDLIDDAVATASDFIGDIVDDFLGDFLEDVFDILLGGPEAIIGLFDQIIADNNGSLTPDGIINEFVPEQLQAALDIPSIEVIDEDGNVTLITPREEMAEAFNSGNKDLFVDKLATATGAPADQLDDLKDGLTSAFDLITLTRAGEVIIDRSNLTLPPALDIKTEFGTDNPSYKFVASIEELEIELRNVGRAITEVIVHWTETYTNANIGADEIKTMAMEFGASDMPYHYVIKRDGSLQRGVPVDNAGTHCPEKDHDRYSIGVVFVGGLNVSTGTSGDDENTQAAALTRAQFNTFYEFMRVFYNIYPGGQALGHGDIVADRTDPGFDVREYVYNVFNKISLYDDATTQDALTPYAINTHEIIGQPSIRNISAEDAVRVLEN